MKVTLKGDGIILAVNDHDSDDYCEFPFIISGVSLFADGEDITKKKGKYLKSKYVHDFLAGREMVLNGAAIGNDSKEFVAEFDIPVSDFDPKKIQLIKSDYEFDEMPYGVVADTIVYDGREYDSISDDLLDYWMMDFHPVKIMWPYKQNINGKNKPSQPRSCDGSNKNNNIK